MNNCSSQVDHKYYCSKYNLDLDDVESVKHYITTGKQSGYFPNRDTEVFYCKRKNFDYEYYKRRYGIIGSKLDILKHWENFGYKNNNYVNKCEEDGKHLSFICRCQIKDNYADTKSEDFEMTSYKNTKEKIYNNEILSSDNKQEETKDSSIVTNDNTLINTCDKNKYIEKVEEKKEKGKNKESIFESNVSSDTSTSNRSSSSSSDDSTNCKVEMINSSSFFSSDTNNIKNKKHKKKKKKSKRSSSTSSSNSTSSSSSSSSSSSKKRKKKRKKKKTDKMDVYNENKNKHNSLSSDNSNESSNTDSTDDDSNKSSNTNSTDDSSNSSVSKDSEISNSMSKNNKEYIFKNEHDDNRIIELHNNNYENDNKYEKESEKYKNDNCESNNKDIIYKNIFNDDNIKENVDINKKIENILSNNVNKSNDTNDEMYKDIDEHDKNKILSKDELLKDYLEKNIKLTQNKLERIRNNVNTIDTQESKDNSVNKFIFDQHMNIVVKNIQNIKKYINMASIYIDTILVILKQAYTCISEICSQHNNYMVYNAGRVKLTNILKELDVIVNTSYYNGLPIFYKKNIKNKNSFIKFPLFMCTNKKMNKILRDKVGDKHEYYIIQLIKISLSDLKLDGYTRPILNKGNVITTHSNYIPPCDCPIGTRPNRIRYTTDDLIKYWDVNFHLEKFEKALYKITMIKEMINNQLNLVEIKNELCYRIKLENLKY
jgi:hypothetical protein